MATTKTEAEVIDGIVGGILALARKVERGPDDTGAILTALKERLLALDTGSPRRYESTQEGLETLAIAIFPYAVSTLMGRAKVGAGFDDDTQLSKEQLLAVEDVFLNMLFANSTVPDGVESRWDAFNRALGAVVATQAQDGPMEMGEELSEIMGQVDPMGRLFIVLSWFAGKQCMFEEVGELAAYLAEVEGRFDLEDDDDEGCTLVYARPVTDFFLWDAIGSWPYRDDFLDDVGARTPQW